MQINRNRLMADLDKLASLTDGTPPGISRLVFGEADQQSRVWLKSQCSEAGLALIPLAAVSTFGAAIAGKAMAHSRHYKRVKILQHFC